MKTSAFLSILHANRGLPLFFSLESGRHVPAGYHLTEIKRVSFESMDCGAMTHAWRETHFELWTSPLPEIRPVFMAAGKFLGIVGRVEAKLPLDGDTEAKIYFGERLARAALYSISGIAVANGRLEVELNADQTQCKAAARRLKALVAGVTSCCGGESSRGESASAAGGCCGVPAPETEVLVGGCDAEKKIEPAAAVATERPTKEHPGFGALGFATPAVRLSY